jgi:hypothetical protein
MRKKKNLTTKPTVHQNQTFTTNFIDLDENMSVDEPTIIKRTRNVLSDSSSSETAQPKTKKKKRRRRTELGRRSIKPKARQRPHHAGRIRKTNRIQPTKHHQLNHQSKKHKRSLFLLEARDRD